MLRKPAVLHRIGARDEAAGRPFLPGSTSPRTHAGVKQHCRMPSLARPSLLTFVLTRAPAARHRCSGAAGRLLQIPPYSMLEGGVRRRRRLRSNLTPYSALTPRHHGVLAGKNGMLGAGRQELVTHRVVAKAQAMPRHSGMLLRSREGAALGWKLPAAMCLCAPRRPRKVSPSLG